MARNRACAALILFVVAAQLAGAEQTPSPPAEREGGIVWSQSYEVGTKVAATEKSPVLLFFTASWCSWCRKLEREVLVEPEVMSELRKFVCVKLDVDRDHDVAMAYGVVSMPRIIVVNTQNEIIGDWLGYRDTKEFLRLLADIRPYVNETVGAKKAPQVNRPAEGSTGGNQASQTAPQEPAQLMDLLGHKELKIRQNAIDTLLKGGPTVLPVVLDALEHEYLGVRIAAWKIIRTLNKTELSFDPWGPRPERAERVKKLREQLKDTPSAAPSAEIPGP
jgi:thiol-disulfide isomerase/thioredoxin